MADKIEKDLDCITWLCILCGKLLRLFHINTLLDASPLQDNESVTTSSITSNGSNSLSHGNILLLPHEVDDESPLHNESIVTSSTATDGRKSLDHGIILLLPDEVEDESNLDNQLIATSNGSQSLHHGNTFLLPDKVDNVSSPLDNESNTTSSITSTTSNSLSHGNILLLPDEVIIDILSRLTFECVVQCRRVCRLLHQLTSTPDYSYMLLSQTTPVIAIQCESLCGRTFDKENKLRAYRVILHFVNQDNNIVALNTMFNFNYMPKGHYYFKPYLMGSYHGLLLFSHFNKKGLIIFNPVTNEQVLVEAPSSEYIPCGLYFHISTGEYRVLYVQCRYWLEEEPRRFYVLSLKSNLLRKTGECGVSPCTCTSPTILNGALHWMASASYAYYCVQHDPPPCSESILVFNTNKEVVSTMPHPGDHCTSKERHRAMQLLEKNGKLCLLDTLPSTSELYIWILDDYKEQVWVMESIINIEPLTKQLLDYISHDQQLLTALDFRNGELLLKTASNSLLHFNLKSRTFREVKRTDFENEDLSSVVIHKNTFATLNCDRYISLGSSFEAD